MSFFVFLSFMAVLAVFLIVLYIYHLTPNSPPPRSEVSNEELREDFGGASLWGLYALKIMFRRKGILGLGAAFCIAALACLAAIAGDGFWTFMTDVFLGREEPAEDAP